MKRIMKSAVLKYGLFALIFLYSTTLLAQNSAGNDTGTHPKRVKVTIAGSITASLNRVLGQGNGDALSAHAGRLTMWWLDLKKDVLKGDTLEILYKNAELPAIYQIHALRYTSQKKERTFSAFLYNGHFYDENGRELEPRLTHAPIKSYFQVTERMNIAGRNHHGVDFKADEGTALFAPYDGIVERIWTAPANGNSLKIKLDHQNQKAYYLHLSKVEPGLKVGMRVKAGQKVAEVGNTGRSTAAHLHYELHDKNEKIIDPYLNDEIYYQTIPAAYVESFTEWRNYYLSLLNAGNN